MYKTIEAGQETKQRDYLGASLIGNPCARQIWYQYNGYPKQPFEATTLMNFADGHASEDITAERLRQVPGIELITHNEQGDQFGFDMLGSKFKGHCDGFIRGLIQAPDTWHIWEHKCSAKKKFDEFVRIKRNVGEKKALKNWNENYYAQAQLYMYAFDLNRHYLTVSIAGSREYNSCRTEYREDVAMRYIERADKIIQAKSEPPRISEKSDFWLCRFCDYREICHVE